MLCMSLQHWEVWRPLTHHVCELGSHDADEACLILFGGCHGESTHCWRSCRTLLGDAHGFSMIPRAQNQGMQADLLDATQWRAPIL